MRSIIIQTPRNAPLWKRKLIDDLNVLLGRVEYSRTCPSNDDCEIEQRFCAAVEAVVERVCEFEEIPFVIKHS